MSFCIWNFFLALDKIKRPLYEKHPMAKFSWTVTEEADTVGYPSLILKQKTISESKCVKYSREIF